jgi:hypothetical protein
MCPAHLSLPLLTVLTIQHIIHLYTIQAVHVAAINVDEEQGQASDMPSSQARDDPHKFHCI